MDISVYKNLQINNNGHTRCISTFSLSNFQTFSLLLLVPKIHGREVGLFAKKTAEIGGVVEVQRLRYLLDTLLGMGQAELYLFGQLLVDKLFGRNAINAPNGFVEIIGGDVHLVGIKFDGTVLAVVLI